MKLPINLSKQYGIMLSGGLDSAILLYLLIQQEPKIQLQPFTIPKFDGSMLYVDPIIDYVSKKFNVKIPKTIEVGDPTVHHRLQSTIAAGEILTKHNVDFLFNALNQNPPELNHLPGAPQRDKKSGHRKILMPFVELYKDQILSLITDIELINLTHSCTEQQVGRCKVCWQCTERAWAFSRLGLEDSGTK